MSYEKEDIPEDPELHRKKILLIFNTVYKFLYSLIDNKAEFYKDLKFLMEKFFNIKATKDQIAEYYN